ncbi:hypothetical protein [Magnetospirillum molischianum]|uniref:Uncharacterized protein n=1 Tax=Magnetospirillum molischianum DSM 120 TaxID=1150626 RepID=H8FYB3_MAGML|nr:hypothetical protein [Magnetospirillum molischianum]CCG43351.1 hypothetical protein PHAMO_80142 [Magnetospirillum molischianum DSM 120]
MVDQTAVDWLNARLRAEAGPIYTQSAPAKLTFKQRDGSFTKHPLIGGEQMRLVEVYMGKRKGAILCFEPIGDWGKSESDPMNDMVRAEIPLNEMPAFFDLFGVTIGELKKGAILPSLDALSGATISKSALSDRYSDNPIWGTW